VKRRLLFAAAALGLLWFAGVVAVYALMSASPGEFGRFMTGVPMPALMLVPFEPLWNHARAGSLRPGDLAPDFELAFHHGAGKARLSASRGVRPVLLIFGSYT
jgi:hypothetical protein